MDDILSKIIIHPIKQTDSLDELTSLLHKSYKKLADLGFKFHASHQDIEVTKYRIDKAECYIATLDKKIIGTVTYYSPTTPDEHEYFGQPFVASFGQFAVDPDFQKIGLGKKLMDIIENCALRDNAKVIAMDTAEGATHLINYYNRRGYNFVTYVQWKVTNYRSVIMAKEINGL